MSVPLNFKTEKENTLFRSNNSYRVSNTLESLPFEQLAQDCAGLSSSDYQAVLDAFAKAHGLKHKSWVYPQLVAHISKWTYSRNSSQKLSPKSLLVQNCKDNAFYRGLYYFSMANSRYVNRQYSKESSNYCALVPIILSAFKKYHGIKYNEWDPEELVLVINPKLYEAAMYPVENYMEEELLKMREIGLTVKTGDNLGSLKSPVTTYGLYGLPYDGSYENAKAGMGDYPQLTRMMLCQTWCAHPNNRTEYMILDPYNWDYMPDPLVSSEVVETKPETVVKLPWE